MDPTDQQQQGEGRELDEVNKKIPIWEERDHWSAHKLQGSATAPANPGHKKVTMAGEHLFQNGPGEVD